MGGHDKPAPAYADGVHSNVQIVLSAARISTVPGATIDGETDDA